MKLDLDMVHGGELPDERTGKSELLEVVEGTRAERLPDAVVIAPSRAGAEEVTPLFSEPDDWRARGEMALDESAAD